MIQKRCIGLFSAFAAFLFSSSVFGHGGVTIEQDRCVFNVQGYAVHFTAYQPDFSKTKELCRTINSLSDTVLVLDFVDEILRNLPVTLVLKKKQSENVFSDFILINEKKYPAGTAHLSLTDVQEGRYRLYVNTPPSSSHHHNLPSTVHHNVNFFEFEIIDATAIESKKNMLKKNIWFFYLLGFGSLIYFVSKWYRNKS